MTPPLPSGSHGAPSKLPPPIGLDRPAEARPIGKAPLQGGDAFIPLDANTDQYKSVQDLLAAIGDEQLFGSVPNAKYQPERNKKYLKVTLAILEVRKYLRGAESNAAIAPQKIEEWLNDADLLSDTVVAHQARVNLIKALKRAPKGQGIDAGVKAMLEALNKNYTPKAAAPKPEAPKAGEKPKFADKPKDASTLGEELSDSKLFGTKLSSYNAERNKKYLAVTLALLEIRKFAKGAQSSTAPAVAKIASWLEDSSLLTDPVAHQARLGLIQACGGAKGSKALSQGLSEILDALKANYSKAPEKNGEAKPVAKTKVKTGAKGLTEVTVNPKVKAKEKREDSAKTFSNGLSAAMRPALNRLLKKYDSLKIKCEMTVSIDDSTGQVVTVSYKNIETSGGISEQDTKVLFETIADNIRSRFRFKSLGESGLVFIKVPLSLVGN